MQWVCSSLRLANKNQGFCVRITGGTHKGRKIRCISAKHLRPTLSKVREAVFSVLGQNLENRTFCDAFAGSGIMGFEAYSRGSSIVGFSETNIRALSLINSTIDIFNDADRFVQSRSARALIASRQWDIVFLDPPYSTSPQPLIEANSNQAKTWVVETARNTQIAVPTGFFSSFERAYGNTKITILTVCS